MITSQPWGYRNIEGREWLGLPPDISPTDNTDPTTVNNWPLRLMRYLGYNQNAAGTYFPCSAPFDLDEDDELYYQFIADSKRLFIYASIPPAVLAELNVAKKYCYRSSGLNYVNFIIEQIQYDLAMDVDLVPAKITVRTINFDINTRVSIQQILNPTTAPYIFGHIKAYFDNSIHGLDQLNVQVVATGAGVGHNNYLVDPVVIPTTPKGTGGASVPIVLDNTSGTFDITKMTVEIRISQGNPKYIERDGVKINFANAGAYWYADLDLNAFNTIGENDFYWITF